MRWYGQRRPNGHLSGGLRRPVNPERRNGIRFAIGTPGSPVEDIVGREMNERRADIATQPRQVLRPVCVDGERFRPVALGPIDGGICGRVDHHRGSTLAKGGLERGRHSDVDASRPLQTNVKGSCRLRRASARATCPLAPITSTVGGLIEHRHQVCCCCSRAMGR